MTPSDDAPEREGDLMLVMSPGSVGLAIDAADLFGLDRVDPGDWAGPVRAFRLTEDEVKAARDIFEKEGITCEVIQGQRRPSAGLAR